MKIFDLNAEISNLKTENESLKTQPASLKPTYPWTEFYEGFDERVEFIGNYHVARIFYYRYINTSRTITTLINTSMIGNNEYLLIIINTDKTMTYIRIDSTNKTAYLNEINGSDEWNSFATGMVEFQLPNTTNINVSSTNQYVFDYIFKKSAA